MKHTPEVVKRATNLYFKIEKSIMVDKHSPSFRDINKMLGLVSSASSQYYVNILEKWGLIKRIKGSKKTITLAKTNYPPVEYRRIK